MTVDLASERAAWRRRAGVTPPPPERITLRQAAKRSGLSTAWIRRLVLRGEIRGELRDRTWHVDRSDVDRITEARRARRPTGPPRTCVDCDETHGPEAYTFAGSAYAAESGRGLCNACYIDRYRRHITRPCNGCGEPVSSRRPLTEAAYHRRCRPGRAR